MGKTVTAKGYVGIIGLENGTTIEILPKIYTFGKHGEEGQNQRNERDVLIDMIAALERIDLRKSGRARVDLRRMNIFEAFISMFLNLTAVLTRKGLRSDYISVEENCNVLKGKLLFHEHLRINSSHAERFFVRYDEYSVNRPENRIIKATLRLLLNLSSNSSNVREIRGLLSEFSSVPFPKSIEHDLSSCHITRATADYEEVLRWCRIFLNGRSATTFQSDRTNSENAIALLFPMHKLFEAYVGQCLKHPERIISAEKSIDKPRTQIAKMDVSTQDRGMKLFEKPGRVNLRPDIVCRLRTGKNPETSTVVLDTKWKTITSWNEVAQGDWYQIYAYGRKYRADQVVLVYPSHDKLACGEYPVGLSVEESDSAGFSVSLFAFDIARPKESSRKLNSIISRTNSL